MVELFSKDLQNTDRRSSKGNQLKWSSGNIWYKADYTGYEGLSEYLISHLLTHSSLKQDEFILYCPDEIRYKSQTFNGVRSKNFLRPGEQLITLERLARETTGRGMNNIIYSLAAPCERLKALVEQVECLTGLKDFGIYMNKLLTIDAIFLNEDRHTHNIAVILKDDGSYAYCPFFDHGAGLLADTTLDYSMDGELYGMIDSVRAKTIHADFDIQLEASEILYGSNLNFSFTKKNVHKYLSENSIYDDAVTSRVEMIMYEQMRRYKPYFRK